MAASLPLKIKETLWVSPSQLWPNPWNPNVQDDFMRRKELTSLKKYGFIKAIHVREKEGPKGEPYQLIDGEQRWSCSIELNIDLVKIENLGEVPDRIAKELTLVLNGIHGEPDTVKLAQMLQGMANEAPEALPEMVEVLPYPPELIDGYLKMFKTPELGGSNYNPGEKRLNNLTFALNTKDANLVRSTLRKIDRNLDKALVKACQSLNTFRK